MGLQYVRLRRQRIYIKTRDARNCTGMMRVVVVVVAGVGVVVVVEVVVVAESVEE